MKLLWAQRITIMSCLATILLLCIYALPVAASDNIKIIMATGMAQISGENITGAKNDATQDAVRQALEQGAGMVMDAKSLLQNDDLMEKVHARIKGSVTGYEIIKEGKGRYGLYEVTINATIDTGALRKSICELDIHICIPDYPRLLILPYPNEAITSITKVAETVLLRDFTDKKFELVDPNKIAELHSEAQELLKVETIENVAARIGLKHNAEIVILYGFEAERASFDGVMESAPINMRSQAIVTTTAQILTAQENTAIGLGNSRDMAQRDGARKSAEALSQPMIEKIVSWWVEYFANGLPYTLTLHTPKKSDMLIIDFQQSIEAISGVVSLSERSSGGGLTEMMVKYKGPTTDLKRGVLMSLRGKPGFEKLGVESSKGRNIVFSVL